MDQCAEAVADPGFELKVGWGAFLFLAGAVIKKISFTKNKEEARATGPSPRSATGKVTG